MQHRPLNFTDDFVAADFFEDGSGLHVESAIVVNLSSDRLIIDDAIKTSIAPWRSAMLSKATIEQSGRIAVLKVCKTVDLGGVMFRRWDWLGNRIRSFPRQTPLFISLQDTVGEVELDPLFFSGEVAVERQLQRFVLKLNLWWSPAETDCFIHDNPPFLEVHTQIFGTGRMQKFRENDQTTLYQDVLMAPGFTHEAFCRVSGTNQWKYPWHRYFADTDAVWLAIELQPIS
ncbi:hypothetical protein X759_27600 [Mesorhizobium sp. LSHC420B00]|nr:hypothetical protein X759_27600 [Mesorhizobium sp. LSHC420B00]